MNILLSEIKNGTGFWKCNAKHHCSTLLCSLFKFCLEGKKSIQCLTHKGGWYREQEKLLCKGLNTYVATEQKENEK